MRTCNDIKEIKEQFFEALLRVLKPKRDKFMMPIIDTTKGKFIIVQK